MWTAAPYQPENLEETITMAHEYYGESWISDPNYLKWQYEDNPWGPGIIHLARDTETGILAGQYAVIPVRFKAFDQTVNGILSLNTLTRPAYSGQGIFTGLAEIVYQECAARGFAFCYGFPNPNSYPGFTQKLSFTDLGRIPLLLRPLNPKALVQKKAGDWLAPLSLPLHPYFAVPKSWDTLSNAKYEVEQLTPLHLAEFENFWPKIQHKYPLLGIRDANFMRWRYFENPDRDYQIYGVRQKGGHHPSLSGYIVGRCTEVADMSCGMIVDFLVEPNAPAAGKALLRRLLRFFAENRLDLAGALMLPHTEEFRLLKAQRFFVCPKFLEPQPFNLIYRRLISPSTTEPDEQAQEDPFRQLNNWFLTMGDYDVI